MAAPFCLRFPPPVILLNNQQEFGIGAGGFLRELVVPAMEEGIMKSKALSCPLQNAAVSNATDLLFSLSLLSLLISGSPFHAVVSTLLIHMLAIHSRFVCLDAQNTLLSPGCAGVLFRVLLSCISALFHRGGSSLIVLASPGQPRLLLSVPWLDVCRMPLLIVALPSFLPEFFGFVQEHACLSFGPFSAVYTVSRSESILQAMLEEEDRTSRIGVLNSLRL